MQDQKDEIRYLHKLLQYYDKWYIEINCPDVAMLQEIADKAKDRVNKVFSKITVSDLWTAYLKWNRGDKMTPESDPYNDFLYFLSDYAWDIGYKYLKGTEKMLYADSVNLIFKMT
jgi:hypothetical protein